MFKIDSISYLLDFRAVQGRGRDISIFQFFIKRRAVLTSERYTQTCTSFNDTMMRWQTILTILFKKIKEYTIQANANDTELKLSMLNVTKMTKDRLK